MVVVHGVVRRRLHAPDTSVCFLGGRYRHLAPQGPACSAFREKRIVAHAAAVCDEQLRWFMRAVRRGTFSYVLMYTRLCPICSSRPLGRVVSGSQSRMAW